MWALGKRIKDGSCMSDLSIWVDGKCPLLLGGGNVGVAGGGEEQVLKGK